MLYYKERTSFSTRSRACAHTDENTQAPDKIIIRQASRLGPAPCAPTRIHKFRKGRFKLFDRPPDSGIVANLGQDKVNKLLGRYCAPRITPTRIHKFRIRQANNLPNSVPRFCAHRRDTSSGQDKTSVYLSSRSCALRKPERIHMLRTRHKTSFSIRSRACAHRREYTSSGKESQATRPVSRFEHRRLLVKTSQEVSRQSRDPRTPMRIHRFRIGQAIFLNSVPRFCALRREYTSSGQDKTSKLLDSVPRLRTPTRTHKVPEKRVKLLDRSPDSSTGDSWSRQVRKFLGGPAIDAHRRE